MEGWKDGTVQIYCHQSVWTSRGGIHSTHTKGRIVDQVKTKKNQMWNERYRVEEYVYGKEPNTYFKDQLKNLSPGNLLLPGEGEGRNAVYAASKNWKVQAFDPSVEGQKKALALAQEKGVEIKYDLSSYLEYQYPKNYYDLVGLFSTHQPSVMRKAFHKKVCDTLKPGGIVILEAFHKDQIHKHTGGPKNLDFLYNDTELLEDFQALEIIELDVLSRVLKEGLFHQGEASVIQLLARKKG